MKRWHYIGLAGILAVGIWYGVGRWQQAGVTASHPVEAEASPVSQSTSSGPRPAAIQWQKVDRTADGFRVEMPADVKQIQIPAYTETGGSQQLQMIFSNPDAETSFSVAWQDNPPVAHANSRTADRTLESARDGAVARTQSTLVNDSPSRTQGFPGRAFEARNMGGGVMNSRLIYAGPRLYMLIASFPSVSARRDKDVTRFFNSFTITSSPGASSPGPLSPGNGKGGSSDPASR